VNVSHHVAGHVLAITQASADKAAASSTAGAIIVVGFIVAVGAWIVSGVRRVRRARKA
jgi:hypothetical protein